MTTGDSPYEPLFNPGTGETYQFIDVGGPDETLRMRWSLQPGGRVPEHVHPRAEERFHIVRGHVRFWLDGDETVCGDDEHLAITPGTKHRFVAGAVTEPVEGFVELEPGLRMREFFEAVSGLSREGHRTYRGVPRNPLQLAAFAYGFWDEFQVTRPPRMVQRAILPLLAAIARRAGYRDHYPRFRAQPLTAGGDN